MKDSKPKLCKSRNGWYIHFRFNGKQYRYKRNINRYQDLKERQREADLLINALTLSLKNGWTPDGSVPQSKKLTFLNALDFAMSKKNASPKTLSGYRGTVKFIKQAVKSLNKEHIVMKEVKRSDIKLFMERAKKTRKWSNKAYNKHLGYLAGIISELYDWDMIDVNPAHKIKKLPVMETVGHKTATKEQQQKIKRHLIRAHGEFYRFVATIFHTGMRPKEILLIKLGMIKNNLIILPPEITKNKRERIVPINNHLMEIFEDMELERYPKDFYLFGSYRQNGKGNVGKYLDFIPAPTPIKRDTATKRWKKVIKDELGIDVSLYSNKHAGADAKILAGIELDALRELYGHKSKQMTERYAKAVHDVYRNEIINKSPEF